VGKNSPYTISFISQVGALARRQFQLKKQDKFSIVTGWATSIIIAIIVGTVYFQLPSTAAGAFTRGGVLFIGALCLQRFSSLSAASLPFSPRSFPLLLTFSHALQRFERF
jgi:ATP-binding cassette subfamily G (WHITE) protein 2 (SNQ2)